MIIIGLVGVPSLPFVAAEENSDKEINGSKWTIELDSSTNPTTRMVVPTLTSSSTKPNVK
jgi:hypothetical protein